VEEPWKNGEGKQSIALDAGEEHVRAKKRSSHLNDEKYEKLLDDFTKKDNSEENVEELNSVLDKFYSQTMKERQKVLKEMKKTVVVMMGQGKTDSSAQTDEELIDLYIEKRRENELNQFDSSDEARTGKTPKMKSRNKQPSAGMVKYQQIQAQRNQTENGSSAQSRTPLGGAKSSMKGGDEVGFNVKPFMLPNENTLINYGYTKNQLFLND